MQWKGPVDDLGPGQSRKVTTTRDKQSPPTIQGLMKSLGEESSWLQELLPS